MIDQLSLRRHLTTLGLLLVVLLVTCYAYDANSPVILAVLICFPLVVFCINNVTLTFAITVALSASALTLPGLPMKLNLHLVLAGLTSIVLFARTIIHKRPIFGRAHSFWVASLMGVMLLTACVRGFGLRVFGGESWGGFLYVSMLLGCFYYIASGNVNLDEKQWQRALIWMCLLSAIPTLSQALYALSGGSLYQMFYFVTFDAQALDFLHLREGGEGMARLQQANVTSQYFFILALLLLARRSWRVWAWVLIAASFVLAGISGHRIALLFNALLAVIFFMADRRASLMRVLFHPLTFCSIMTTVLLAVMAEHLPMTFQRMLSLIPFANVSWEARVSAESTIGWRIEVWLAALKQVPDYLIIGKGFVFQAQEIMTISARMLSMNDIDFVLASRNYHNGIIHTLLDLGLPGLIASLGFMISACVRHFLLLRRTWTSPLMQHFHRVIFAVFIATIIVFFVLAGGVSNLATLFFWAMLLEGFVRADINLQARQEKKNAVPEEKPASRRIRLSPEAWSDLR